MELLVTAQIMSEPTTSESSEYPNFTSVIYDIDGWVSFVLCGSRLSVSSLVWCDNASTSINRLAVSCVCVVCNVLCLVCNV